MAEKVTCNPCGQPVRVRKDGTLYKHHDPARNGFVCAGVPALILHPMSDPAPTVEETTTQGDDVAEKGPWFGAVYEGRCSVSECQIEEGDRIRADGEGGYECEDCGGEYEDGSEGPVERADRVAAEQERAALPTADEFMDSTTTEDVQPVMSVSGQPKEVLRDHMGRYAVVLPGEVELETYKTSGKPVGRTRATTFNKAATDKKNINDWGKRNVVIGASRRRDLLLKAQGLTHENDRDRLNAIVVELEEAAGSKVGSDLGTFLHEFTEYMDAGLKTWRDAPEEFQRSLAQYEMALEDAGLEPTRGLIERTTIIREYGWVCGTFDRIFYHRPSGQYVIGDLKTGKTMDYGKNEVECQLWTYAHGVNQNGIYDWNTDTWEEPHTLDNVNVRLEVSETVGVVVHMPVQGPKEGTVELLWADLENGARHAQRCHEVRSQPKGKMKPWGDGPAPIAAPAARDWDLEFRQAMTGERASRLWREAKEAGIAGIRLNELIELARESIRELASRVDV